MPGRETIKRARQKKSEGKSASTQAGEFVREKIEAIRAGKHGARSAKQAIAIGLSMARRAGVRLPPPKKGTAPAGTRRKAERDLKNAAAAKKPSPVRSRAALKALRRERTDTVSPSKMSAQTRAAAKIRSMAEKSAARKKATRSRKRAKN